MSIKDLIEISGWDNLEDLTRKDIITLAKLPNDFVLRDLPEFPTPQEAENLMSYFIGRHTSNLTDEWPDLHSKVLHYPRLVQQCLLQACNGRTKREFSQHTVYGYGFSINRYRDTVADVRDRHKKISDILNNTLAGVSQSPPSPGPPGRGYS